jgi:hypothetical protein
LRASALPPLQSAPAAAVTVVTQRYDDEDMEETGEDYKALLNVPLELIMKVY